MRKITKKAELLHQLLADARQVGPIVQVSEYLTIFELDKSENFPCRGLTLDLWIPVMAELTRPEQIVKRPMSEPLAMFISQCLADLAERGADGAISIEQAIIMLAGNVKMRSSHLRLKKLDRTTYRIKSNAVWAATMGYKVDAKLSARRVRASHFAL